MKIFIGALILTLIVYAAFNIGFCIGVHKATEAACKAIDDAFQEQMSKLEHKEN